MGRKNRRPHPLGWVGGVGGLGFPLSQVTSTELFLFSLKILEACGFSAPFYSIPSTHLVIYLVVRFHVCGINAMAHVWKSEDLGVLIYDALPHHQDNHELEIEGVTIA